MEGLEGLKILEAVANNTSIVWTVIFGVMALICVILIIFGVICDIEELGFYITLAVLGILCGVLSVVNIPNKEREIYKVTPIEEKYYIDLSKYKIIDQNGEIITIEEIK